MAERAELRPDETYAFWWLHDARWYQEVAAEFGAEAANTLNRRALRFIAARVAENLRRKSAKSVEEMPWDEVVELFSACAEVMWPDVFVRFESTPLEDDHFKVDMTHNFSLEMLRRAGSLDTYECGCLDIRQGWFEGLGLEVTADRVECCMRKGSPVCTFDAYVDRGTQPQP